MRLELALDLEEEKFMEEKVKVLILKDLSDVFNGEDLLRLGKGVEIDLPRWLAEYLVDKGYAKYSREVDIVKLSKEISKYKFLENKHKEDPYPVQLNKDFYKIVKMISSKTRERLKESEYDIKMDEIFNIMNKLIKIRNDIEEIAELRILKMLKYIVSNKELPVEFIERCTPEEIALARELKDTIDEWYEKALGEKE